MRFGKDEIYFEQLENSLDDHVTLFVGKNGAGKSTILDAIAIAVSTFLCGIEGGISQLRTVEAAVCACFRRISKAEQASLSFDLDTHRIMVEYTDAAKEKRRFALASRVAADHITGFAKYLSKSTVPCHVPCSGSH